MKDRVFLTNSILFIISIIFLSMPYIITVLGIIELNIQKIFVGPIVSYVLFALRFHRFIRAIRVKNGRFMVRASFTPVEQMQHRVNVRIEDIVIINFCFIMGNSKGKRVARPDEIPCLELTLKDEKVEKIVLLGFTRRKIKEIEKCLLENNPEILVDHNASFFDNNHTVFWH